MYFINNYFVKLLGLPSLLILLVENGRNGRIINFVDKKNILSPLKFKQNPRQDHPDPAPDGRGRGRGEAKMDVCVGVGVGVRKNG